MSKLHYGTRYGTSIVSSNYRYDGTLDRDMRETGAHIQRSWQNAPQYLHEQATEKAKATVRRKKAALGTGRQDAELRMATALREAVARIYVDAKIKNYIVDIVQATRDPAKYGLEMTGLIQFGASPRATIALVKAARAQAFLEGRGYVTPQDIKSSVFDVMRHRIIVSYEAEAEELKAENLIQRILERLPVP